MKADVSDTSRNVRVAENICALVHSAASGKETLCLARGESRKLNLNRSWCFIRLSDGAVIGFVPPGVTNEGARYLHAVRVAKTLRAFETSSGALRISAESAQREELLELPALIQENSGAPAAAFIAIPKAKELRALECTQRAWPRMLRASLAVCGKHSLLDSARSGNIVSPLDFIWTLRGIDERERIVRIEAGIKWGITVSETQIEMEQFPVRIEIGTILLTADALINLRAGDVVTIPAPQELLGTLRVGNEAWAEVAIACKADGVTLTVRELLVPGETSGEKFRLRE